MWCNSIKEATSIKLIWMHHGILKELQHFCRERSFGFPETEMKKVCPC
jgi:hypothetical protein